MSKTVKITSKGQITIPGPVRKALNSDIVEFEIKRGFVIIKPVKNVAGALNKYARRKASLEKIRDSVWKDIAEERGQS